MIDKLKYWLYRAEWNYQALLNRPKLLNLDLELSSKCNLTCPQCYHESPETVTWKPQFMNASLAYQLIQKAKEENIPAIKFNFRGEPTLHPMFNEIVAYSKKIGILDRLVNTSLQFKDPRKINALLNCTKIIVSIDSFDKETYEKIRRGGKYETFIRNLNTLYSLLLHDENRLILQFVAQDQNYNENFKEVIKHYPKAILSVREIFPRGRDDSFASPNYLLRHDIQRKICIYPYNRLIVTADGKALACCPDYNEKFIVGFVKQAPSLKSIFHSNKMNRLRKLVYEKKYDNELCKNCTSWISYKK